MELQILLILAVAFLVLGPEKSMEMATKLGEFLRKIREVWDELRYQMYMENLNRKIMEETKDTQVEDEFVKALQEEEAKEDEHAKTGAPDDAPDGPSEGAKKQAD